MLRTRKAPESCGHQNGQVGVAKGRSSLNNPATMSMSLEIHLTSDLSGVRLSFTRFKNTADGTRRDLVVSGELERAGFEPDETERLRSYGKPQRAILVLLLWAFSSEFKRATLNSDYSPELARSLFGILRKQSMQHRDKAWLSKLTGLHAQEPLATWFISSGSTSLGRPCYVKLNPTKWQAVSLVVKMNESATPVPVADYEQLAKIIEFGGVFDAPKDSVTIDIFKLLAWNSSLNGYVHKCDKVQHGDRVQLQIRLNQPAHLYALWLDHLGQAVTLYPWSNSDWKWPMTDRKVGDLVIPNPQRDDEGNALRVEGPAGVENIIVLARNKPIDRKEAQTLQGMIEGSKLLRDCPKPEIVVVSKFDRTPRLEKPTRTVRRLAIPPDVKTFQARLAAILTPHFDQVLISTFTNEGQAR
jgi:hypothetical protein